MKKIERRMEGAPLKMSPASTFPAAHEMDRSKRPNGGLPANGLASSMSGKCEMPGTLVATCYTRLSREINNNTVFFTWPEIFSIFNARSNWVLLSFLELCFSPRYGKFRTIRQHWKALPIFFYTEVSDTLTLASHFRCVYVTLTGKTVGIRKFSDFT